MPKAIVNLTVLLQRKERKIEQIFSVCVYIYIFRILCIFSLECNFILFYGGFLCSSVSFCSVKAVSEAGVGQGKAWCREGRLPWHPEPWPWAQPPSQGHTGPLWLPQHQSHEPRLQRKSSCSGWGPHWGGLGSVAPTRLP